MAAEPAHKGVVDVAAVLLTVGRDRAARLLAHFEAEEVTLLSRQTDNLANLTQAHLNKVALSFETEFTKGAGLLNPGRSFTDILNETRADVLQQPEEDDIAEVEEATDPWKAIASLSDNQLLEFLTGENAVITAFILSKLPPEKAASVLKEFEPDERTETILLMMDVKATARMEEMLAKVLTNQFAGTEKEEGENENWQTVASIINCFDADDGDALTQSLKGSASEDGFEAVVQNIFRFDDIVSLEADACTKLCGAIDNGVLTTALHGASPEIAEALLSTLSPRARRMVDSELENGTPKDAEIETARRSITQTVLALAKDDQLEMPDRA